MLTNENSLSNCFIKIMHGYFLFVCLFCFSVKIDSVSKTDIKREKKN